MSEEKRGCCCGKKTTMRSEEERKKLINRLSRIEGQIRGIKGMLENEVVDELVATLQKLMK